MESIITYDIFAGCLLRNFNMDLFLENAANPTYFMLNFLTKLIENGTDGDLVYFDLAKVFDSVSHNRLIISGNLSLWIRNFLSHR